MSAPKGTQFWKLRSKHGRDKLFSDPAALWEAACEYFQWCDDNPWLKVEQRKGSIVIPKDFDGGLGDYLKATLELPTARPYSIQRLCLYLDCNTAYFRQFKASLAESRNNPDADQQLIEGFSTVITRIEEIIYAQKFEGAAVGAFNASIIARDLGLSEKVEAKNTNTNFNHNAEMSPEEIKAISKGLEEQF